MSTDNNLTPQLQSLKQTQGLALALPSVKLQPYVLNYWLIKRKILLDTIQHEYVHPNGGMGLIFNLGDPLYFDNNLVRDKYFMDGTHTTSSLLGLTGDIFAIGIRFLPGGAFPFFSSPLKDINNLTINIDELETKNSDYIYEQLHLAQSMNEVVAILEKWLLSNYDSTNLISSHVLNTVKSIQLSEGRTTLKDIVSHLDIGQRQLERLFKDQIGMTPKKMTRIIQIERARKILRSTNNTTIEQKTHLDGFYDQAHFIKEFQSIIGKTPGAYLTRNASRA